MKTYQFKTGEFTLNSPNVVEGLRLETSIRRKFPKSEDIELTATELLAITIEEMEKLVSDIKIKGIEDPVYRDLLGCKAAKNEIIQAADSIIEEIFLPEKKKDS